jgi:tRNA pseudouridine65 synthase
MNDRSNNAQGIQVLYRDEHLVAVSKPGGMPVHHSSEHRDAKVVLLQTVRNQLGCHVNPLHRLDRPTSGIVLLTLEGADGVPSVTAAFAAALSREDTEKIYIALVRGRFPAGPTTVDRPLTNKTSGKVQEARTDFERIRCVDLGDRFGVASLIEARLHSGRRHQIRRHVSHLRHQVLVDSNYGKGAINRYCRNELGIPRLFLHAARLELTHPITHRRLAIECPLPPDLADPLAKLAPAEDPSDG